MRARVRGWGKEAVGRLLRGVVFVELREEVLHLVRVRVRVRLGLGSGLGLGFSVRVRVGVRVGVRVRLFRGRR